MRKEKEHSRKEEGCYLRRRAASAILLSSKRKGESAKKKKEKNWEENDSNLKEKPTIFYFGRPWREFKPFLIFFVKKMSKNNLCPKEEGLGRYFDVSISFFFFFRFFFFQAEGQKERQGEEKKKNMASDQERLEAHNECLFSLLISSFFFLSPSFSLLFFFWSFVSSHPLLHSHGGLFG